MPLGLGQTISIVTMSNGYLEDPFKMATAHWRNMGYNAAPNGSLMRTHPAGLFGLLFSLKDSDINNKLTARKRVFDLAAELSIVTHVDPRCIVSCAVGSELVRGLVLGEIRCEHDIHAVLEEAILWYDEKWKPLLQERDGEIDEKEVWNLNREVFISHAWAESLGELELDDSQKMGYVLKCLDSGIFLLRKAMRKMKETRGSLLIQVKLFKELITELVMLGGDADTNACFAGALLGAYIGYKALPSEWRDGLNHGVWLTDKAEALASIISVKDGEYNPDDNQDTAKDGGRGMLMNEEMESRWQELITRVARETPTVLTKKKA